jgi:hypothetical protein
MWQSPADDVHDRDDARPGPAAARRGAVHPNTVSLWRGRFGAAFAVCQCGWQGRLRFRVRAAAADAHHHVATSGHEAGRPLDLWKAGRSRMRRPLHCRDGCG